MQLPSQGDIDFFFNFNLERDVFFNLLHYLWNVYFTCIIYAVVIDRRDDIKNKYLDIIYLSQCPESKCLRSALLNQGG